MMDLPASEEPAAEQPAAEQPAAEQIVTSPCISVCAVDKALGMCIGCLRTLKEIGAWRSMTPAEKKAVVAACEERALTMPRRGKDWRPLPAS